jgi:hypothetical protein
VHRCTSERVYNITVSILSLDAELLHIRLKRVPHSQLCVLCAGAGTDADRHQVMKAIRDLILDGAAACRRDVCSACATVAPAVFLRF